MARRVGNYVIGDAASLEAAKLSKQRVQSAVAQGGVLSPTLSSSMTGNVYVLPTGATINVKTGEVTPPNAPPPVVSPGAGSSGISTPMILVGAAVVGGIFFALSKRKGG